MAGPTTSRLWPHQREAITVVESFQRGRRGAEGPSALVRMPAGTGKSGVIAVAAHDLAGDGDVLLLTPWDALAGQLLDDVRQRFWDTIGAAAPSGKRLTRIYPSTAALALAATSENTIWLATIATLQRLHAGRDAAYQQLRARLRLVVVDEGHYEPARTWSDAVRGLGRPTVLFTATPYRNDAKYFDIDDQYQFHYSHAQAEIDHILRRAEFEPIAFHDAGSFCGELTDLVERRLAGYQEAKVIVRCHSLASVRNVVSELLRRGQPVIGIHERFGRGDDVWRQNVPRPDQCDARYWVHQYKLTEGIDSGDFRAVAFFEPLPTERAFVQQVGRVLRNPARSATEAGLVIHHRDDRLDASWARYRAFDLTATRAVASSPIAIARSQTEPQYYGGKFRSTFDIEGDLQATDFLYPRSAKIYQLPAGFDLAELTAAVQANLDDNDCVGQRVLHPDPGTRVHVYLAVGNTPLLATAVYYQFGLGLTYYQRTKNYLFFNDSLGLRPPWLDALPIVAADRLQRLYHGTNAAIRSVSLANTDLGPFTARRRTLHARSIGDLGPDLSDHAQLATTSSGHFQTTDGKGESAHISRYVGFTRARVTDRGLVEFDAYQAWIAGVAAALDDRRARPLPVFGRFAEIIDQPADPTPRNILLDIDADDFVDRHSETRERLRIDELCLEVNDGSFTCTANDTPYRVAIKWDQPQRRYLLTCPELDRRFANPDAGGGPAARALIGYLNARQAFRVVPAGGSGDYCIYTGRKFCRPRLPLGPRARTDSPDLVELIEGVDELAAIGSEKGGEGSATPEGWAAATLFGFIDRLGAGSSIEPLMSGIDVLVCDDMGVEIADFIALDSARRRVIAIHAKAFKRARPLSASALHEVSSQALKNLGSFQPYSVGDPPNLRLWAAKWNGPAGPVDRRIRLGTGTPRQIWSQIREALKDPRATREVWIMLGQGPSKELLLSASRERHPRPEVVQMLYSLQSTWGAVSSVGARLRILSAT